jgi:hypothetical protein
VKIYFSEVKRLFLKIVVDGFTVKTYLRGMTKNTTEGTDADTYLCGGGLRK